jgi:hypothetical protein
MMSRFTQVVIALLLMSTATSVYAQNNNNTSVVLPGGAVLEGTPEEQAACSGDAHRYCKDAIPDNFKVLDCLKAERTKISKACQLVLQNHRQ